MISVVDDEESVREATRTLLRSAGCRVQTFDSAQALLDSGVLPETECLILDVRMPGMDGLELLRCLNSRNIHVPAIFITAHDDGSLRQRALAAGALDLLRKPFPASVLLEKVRVALGGGAAL